MDLGGPKPPRCLSCCPRVWPATPVWTPLVLSCASGKQIILRVLVLNLTAASAAVGGFFGFPMAGARFVLEIPHRIGLQHFEALSPATIAPFMAVLVNRMVVGNDMTGKYKYVASVDSAIIYLRMRWRQGSTD